MLQCDIKLRYESIPCIMTRVFCNAHIGCRGKNRSWKLRLGSKMESRGYTTRDCTVYSVYNVCFLSYSDAFMYGIPNILPTYKREVKRNKWAPVRVYGYLTMSLPQPLTSHKLNWSSHIHTCTPILNEVTLLFPSDVQLC